MITMNIFLSSEEARVLSQIVNWTEEYSTLKARGVASVFRPTTEKCSKHFGYVHRKMLALLNRLEEKNLVIKRRQLASGPTCAGYNGASYSEVILTDFGREVYNFYKERNLD